VPFIDEAPNWLRDDKASHRFSIELVRLAPYDTSLLGEPASARAGLLPAARSNDYPIPATLSARRHYFGRAERRDHALARPRQCSWRQ
jgi:hypothetical protein